MSEQYGMGLHLHIISRKQAKELGMDYYFGGVACKYGGDWPRRTSTRACMCPSHRRDRKECKGKRNSAISKERAETKRNIASIEAGDVIAKSKHRAIENGDSRYISKNRCVHGMVLWRSLTKDRVGKVGRCPCTQCANGWKKTHQKSLRSSRDKYRSDPEYRDYMLAYAARRERRTRRYQSRCELTDFVMKEALSLSRERLAQTGVEWHVDHMIPLKARGVSGIHRWDNLQVIPAPLNKAKSNKMIYTEPFEWLKDA